jgi:hypothetical protein
VRNAHGAAGFGHSLHVFACKPFRNGLQNDDELAHLAQQQSPLRRLQIDRQSAVIRLHRGSGEHELVSHRHDDGHEHCNDCEIDSSLGGIVHFDSLGRPPCVPSNPVDVRVSPMASSRES